MHVPVQQSVTELLHRHNEGDEEALDAVVCLLHAELSKLARHYLRVERPNHTLDTRALVNESYMRLVGQRKVSWQNRKHFFGIASRTMRRVLCDYARRRQSEKRGGPHGVAPLDFNDLASEYLGTDPWRFEKALQIDDALRRLAKKDPVAVELIELRYFAGLTLDEISDILGFSMRTLSRKWRFARAWLYKELKS